MIAETPQQPPSSPRRRRKGRGPAAKTVVLVLSNGHGAAHGSEAIATPTTNGRSSAAAAPSGPDFDRALVDRCLQGDKAAWTKLYDECQPPLLLAIQVLLGRSAVRRDLVDDIAAKVWFTVVDRQGELLDRFDATRGCRLTTFLAGVAKNEISRHFRAERRRNLREVVVCRSRDSAAGDSHWHNALGLNAAVAEFLATLTPRERAYCEEFLLARAETPSGTYSAANRWQLQHRVREKLWAYLQSV